MNQQLQDSYDAIARNDTATAQSILAKLIVSEKDPSVLEQAWLYMSYAVDGRDRKKECLERVLLLNPSNSTAKEMLSQLMLDSSDAGIGNTSDENLSPTAADNGVSIDIDNLTGIEFEKLVMQLLNKMDLQVQETKTTGDGGIDIEAFSSAPITGGLFIVQCKRLASSVGEPVIRDLYGVVSHVRASKGILITNSRFTKQAVEFASGKPLELIDGNQLRQLLSKYGITKTATERLFIYSPAFKELIQGIMKVVADYHSTALSVGTSSSHVRSASLDDVMAMLAKFIEEFSPLISGLISPIQEALNQGDGLTDSHVLELIEVFRSNFGKYSGTLDEFKRTEFKFQHVKLGREQQHELKRLTIEMITEPIREYSLFLQEFDKELEELHGKLVDPDFVPTFTFKPDISQVEARVESFIAKYV